MKKFKVTFSETRTISTIVEAEDENAAYDIFHTQYDNGEHYESFDYSGEETIIEPVSESKAPKASTDESEMSGEEK